jgi:hypothetical protein
MANVFVVQDPSDKNILPAERFGKLRVLLFKKDIDRGYDYCAEQLSEKLSGITDNDHILLIGDPILIGIATHMAFHYSEGRVNFLRWIREDYCYQQETITI